MASPPLAQSPTGDGLVARLTRHLGARPAAPDPSPLGTDAGAAVVVALVALPLCLGIALASGAPLLAGLVSGIVGGIVVGVLSGSPLLVSGPAAGLTAIVLAAITGLGSYERFLVAVVVAGALQVGLAFTGAGVIANFFPSSVIRGMLAAIGLILILKQIPHALGWDADAEGDEAFRQVDGENTFSELMRALEHVEPLAIVISGVALVLLFAWGRFPAPMARIPAPLVIVTLAVLGNTLAATMLRDLALGATHLVQLPMEGGPLGLIRDLPRPEWSALMDPAVLRVAVTLAIVASLETLLSLEATDKMDPWKRNSPPNRELFAQGIGNALAGLGGGLPITGVIVRSAANVTAGARTHRAAVMHGVLLLAAVLAIPGLLNRIPLAVLAAILLHTGIKLAHPDLFRRAWRTGMDYFVPFVVTIVAILFTDLLVGILIGLAMGTFFILREQGKRPALTRVSPPGAVLTRFRLPDQATYLLKASLTETLASMPPRSRLEIDGRETGRFDYDILEVLHDFRQTAAGLHIDYRLVGIPELPGTPAGSGH